MFKSDMYWELHNVDEICITIAERLKMKQTLRLANIPFYMYFYLGDILTSPLVTYHDMPCLVCTTLVNILLISAEFFT